MGRIALIAHDGKKEELLELVHDHVLVLRDERLVTTNTTGRLIADRFGLDVERMASGPHGGDLQVGALVASGDVALVVFLRDPLASHPHEPDIQALMKICDVHRIPLATNAATAELCLVALGRNELGRAA
jgi:methylglyoxal synthase